MKRGLVNLQGHVENVRKYGVPVCVALNRFLSDSQEEMATVLEACASWGVRAALSDVWAKGGEGGEAVAQEILAMLEEGKADFKPIYDASLSIATKIETVTREIYGADGVDFLPAAQKAISQLNEMGMGDTPVCIAKDPVLLQRRPHPAGPAQGLPGHHPGCLPVRRRRLRGTPFGAVLLCSKCISVCSPPGRRGAPAADRPRGKCGGAPGSAGGEPVAVLIHTGRRGSSGRSCVAREDKT